MKPLFIRALSAIALMVLAAFHYSVSRITHDNFHFAHFALLCSLMALFFVMAFIIHKKRPYPFSAILLFMAMSAIPYLYTSPVLSDDVFRFIWEGHVQNEGFNPFLTPPASLIFRGDSLTAHVNFPEIPAVYPPFIQLVFRGLSKVSLSIQFFKAFFMVAAGAVFIVLYKKKERFKDAYFFWAVLPLITMETAWSGHFDAFGILLFLVSVVFLEKSNGLFAGLFLALAISVKWMPLMFVPIFFIALPKRERLFFLSSLLLIPILYAPFLSAGRMLFFALFNYANHWWHDGAFFMVLRLIGLSERVARFVLLIFFASIYAAIFLKVKDLRDKIYLALFALTLLSPVLWPWYLLWLIPFGAARFPYTTLTQALLSFASYYCLENGYVSSNYTYTVLMSATRVGIVIAVFIGETAKRSKMTAPLQTKLAQEVEYGQVL